MALLINSGRNDAKQWVLQMRNWGEKKDVGNSTKPPARRFRFQGEGTRIQGNKERYHENEQLPMSRLLSAGRR